MTKVMIHRKIRLCICTSLYCFLLSVIAVLVFMGVSKTKDANAIDCPTSNSTSNSTGCRIGKFEEVSVGYVLMMMGVLILCFGSICFVFCCCCRHEPSSVTVLVEDLRLDDQELASRIINLTTVETVDPSESCCICLDVLNNGNIVASTECLHVFHKDCITEWSSRKRACPLCGREI